MSVHPYGKAGGRSGKSLGSFRPIYLLITEDPRLLKADCISMMKRKGSVGYQLDSIGLDIQVFSFW